MPRGPRPTTGRYETRGELVYWAHHWYYSTKMSMAQVARACRVSEGVVINILKKEKPCQPTIPSGS